MSDNCIYDFTSDEFGYGHNRHLCPFSNPEDFPVYDGLAPERRELFVKLGRKSNRIIEGAVYKDGSGRNRLIEETNPEMIGRLCKVSRRNLTANSSVGKRCDFGQ